MHLTSSLTAAAAPPDTRYARIFHIRNLGTSRPRANERLLPSQALHWKAEATSKSTVARPLFGMCCNNGKVVFPALEAAPDALARLYTGDDAQAKEFRKNIAQYNTALSVFAFVPDSPRYSDKLKKFRLS
ncbi:hypothetical protein R3P38DRAFT_3104075 [Favolaschia claudopus]|uniref:Uncharacterized protein n=1 Tax=Favolaschia claudopus TaxID=2862362 RepID=A0AAV9ZK53_9AGAR